MSPIARPRSRPRNIRARVLRVPRRPSINVSRGVISFSAESCVKYQIKRRRAVYLSGRSWPRPCGGAGRGGGAVAGGEERERLRNARGWIFDARGENVNIARYPLSSELPASQSERVLTLAAHSAPLPLFGPTPPPLRSTTLCQPVSSTFRTQP